MEILGQAKNGVVTQAIKQYHELTQMETKALIFAVGTSKEDYQDYMVHYNKKNELIRVVPNVKISKNNFNLDVVDAFVAIERAVESNKIDREKAYAIAFEMMGV